MPSGQAFPLPAKEILMPLAQLYIGPGRSPGEKQRLIENVTGAVTAALGPLRQPVWVIINEVPLSDWGVDGRPVRPPAI
jgi:4-oxalocrotonate tautomerase family enzyme